MKKSFYAKVYKAVKRIPKGKVATYKQIAKLAGNSKAARAVGTAMKLNPDMKTIPCHRVVGSDGAMHGYSAKNGTKSKMEMLNEEGIIFIGNKVDLKNCKWSI